MDSTQKHKILTIDNSGMSEMFSKIFWQIREVNNDINEHQNEIKRAALELYDRFKKDYKRYNRAKTHFGSLTLMELEEEAHNYAMTKTVVFFNEFTDTDNAIVERFSSIVNDSPKTFFKALKEVLGEEK